MMLIVIILNGLAADWNVIWNDNVNYSGEGLKPWWTALLLIETLYEMIMPIIQVKVWNLDWELLVQCLEEKLPWALQAAD